MKRTSVLNVVILLASLLLSSCIFRPRDYVEDAGCNLNMKMIYVEGGTFRMGATSEQGGVAENDEYPIHTITLDSYYIAECEVTQAQWERIVGTSLYYQYDRSYSDAGLAGVGADYPMYYVDWAEAQAFCRELSRMTGKTYVLPTEAQWEYAARGGKYQEGYIYSGGDYLEQVGWCYDCTTHPVKQKHPNSLGLYDMSGNVWEWCSDWYSSSYYSYTPQRNPGGAASGIRRVLRGGSWYSKGSDCRVSNRARSNPTDRDHNNGFRVVCIP